MPMPDIDEANRKKPLSYDPSRKKYIYFDDIVSRRAPVILPSTLSKADQKKLVIERQIAGPDYTTQAISGPPMKRDDVVKAIRTNQEYGKITVEAEITYLGGLLEEIKRNLV
jgi:hypothetical protein